MATLSGLTLAGFLLATPSAPTETERFFARLMTADNKGDVEVVASCYHEDAVLMPPSGPPIQGRDLIKERYRSLFETARLEVTLVSDELHVFGDWAASRGRT